MKLNIDFVYFSNLNLINIVTENIEADIMAVEQPKPPPQVDEIMKPIEPPIQPVIKSIISESLSRRVSQESVITTTTTTSTRTSSSSDSSADSSSDSDSSSSDETTDGADKESVFVSQETINEIYKMCIKNLEECITRFPEHYKSIYRIVHHYSTVGNSIEICKQLLLKSDYKSALGNKINGLFTERKNNNFFNGIWRNPSPEIDRPGNFTTHLSKCIIVLMEVLKKTNDYDTLMDLTMQLQKAPDADKKYLNDQDRKDLFQQAVACCVQAFKNKLREIPSNGKASDKQLIDLMLDIFKAHRKTFKIFQQKEQNQFAVVLVEVYKEYIKDKMTLPENANHNDLAFKLCQSEINYRKNLEKGIIPSSVVQPPHHLLPATSSMVTPQSSQPSTVTMTTSSVTAAPSPTPLLIKSVSEINKSVEPPKSSNSPASNKSSTPTNSTTTSINTQKTQKNKSKSQSSNSMMNAASMSQLLQLYSNPAMLQQLSQMSQMSQLSSLDTNALLNEYMKSMMSASSLSSLTSMTPQQIAMLSSMNDPMMASLMASSYGSMSPKSSSPKSSPKTGTNVKESTTKKPTATTTNSSTLLGFQQNLLSNSLTITTTTMTTATSSKSTMSRAQSHGGSKKSKEPSLSISKSDMNLAASSMNLKYPYLGSNVKLPDLPKSLSITPSIPAQKQKQQSSTILQEKAKTQQRPKQQQQQQAMQSMYNRSSLSITPDQQNFTTSELKAYQDFLATYNKSLATHPVPKQRSNPMSSAAGSSSSLKVQSKQKSSPQLNSQMKKNLPVQPVVKSSTSTTQMPYDFGKNIASSFNNPSPSLSISPFPSSSSPSISPSQNSSKTLQQKLAERKRKQHKKDGKFLQGF